MAKEDSHAHLSGVICHLLSIVFASLPAMVWLPGGPWHSRMQVDSLASFGAVTPSLQLRPTSQPDQGAFGASGTARPGLSLIYTWRIDLPTLQGSDQLLREAFLPKLHSPWQ